MRSVSIVFFILFLIGVLVFGFSSIENSLNIDGERGDFIEFYNKVNINELKNIMCKVSFCFV